MKIHAICINQKCADYGMLKHVEVGNLLNALSSQGLHCVTCKEAMKITNVRGERFGNKRRE